MGYKLYREVKVWAPDTLTKGEKLAALVLADDANDVSRLTYHGVHDPEIMRQAMVPDDRAMRRVLAKLQKEKVVEHAGGGHNGRVSKYRFLHLAPSGWAAPGDASKAGENNPPTGSVEDHQADGFDVPDVGKQGENNPPTDEADAKNHPPTGGVGGSFSTRRRVKTTRPTPPYTSTSSSSPRDAGDQPSKTKTKKTSSIRDRIIDATGATPEEAQALIDQIRPEVKHSLSGLITSLIENEDMHERLRKLKAARAPRPRPARAQTKCTRHYLALPCDACASDIKTRAFGDVTKLLHDHGPDKRWDLAQNEALAQHLGESA
ncbi:hypothetical protein DFP74_5787 [Nocardiopsis sp. Huas11]|uniref:hypothetical protein n=1 Tax=Nocardiopsis sp. Huas11 TaxID=2183912 RepID=UPI000F27F041|nr:hypothetical protein [Nocardiopsis sp. Huas11]RKS10040.1 hypothetical protein DFP74_5787 [Nocardiopsis sp. Huas11]